MVEKKIDWSFLISCSKFKNGLAKTHLTASLGDEHNLYIAWNHDSKIKIYQNCYQLNSQTVLIFVTSKVDRYISYDVWKKNTSSKKYVLVYFFFSSRCNDSCISVGLKKKSKQIRESEMKMWSLTFSSETSKEVLRQPMPPISFCFLKALMNSLQLANRNDKNCIQFYWCNFCHICMVLDDKIRIVCLNSSDKIGIAWAIESSRSFCSWIQARHEKLWIKWICVIWRFSSHCRKITNKFEK